MPSSWSKQPSFITAKFLNDGTGDATIGGTLTTAPSGIGGQQDQTRPGDRIVFGPADALAASNNSVGNLYGGLYQYVTCVNNSTATALRGHGVFTLQVGLSTQATDNLYVVTPDEPANVSVSLFVGVVLNNNIAKGNSWWVQTAGKVAAKFRTTLSANAAIGGGVYLAAGGNNANAADVGAFDQGSNNAANQTYFQIAIDQAITRYVGVAEQLPTNNNITVIDMDFRRVRW
jgi:hypothetical protein